MTLREAEALACEFDESTGHRVIVSTPKIIDHPLPGFAVDRERRSVRRLHAKDVSSSAQNRFRIGGNTVRLEHSLPEKRGGRRYRDKNVWKLQRRGRKKLLMKGNRVFVVKGRGDAVENIAHVRKLSRRAHSSRQRKPKCLQKSVQFPELLEGVESGLFTRKVCQLAQVCGCDEPAQARRREHEECGTGKPWEMLESLSEFGTAHRTPKSPE